MKKWLAFLVVLLVFSLCACSSSGPNEPASPSIFKDNNITLMKGWSFQYNISTDDYSLFFELCNKNEESLASDATVQIRIVNDDNEVVYEGTKQIYPEDFGYYTSQADGERYLANLKIPASEIEPGKSSNGTVYFTVTKTNHFDFDESNCKAFYNLPTKKIEVITEALPVEVTQKAYDGSIQAKFNIDGVDWEEEKVLTSSLQIIITGEKTYGDSNSRINYDIISYKLYDSEGFMIKSGNIYLDSLDVGDKFKNDSLFLYDVTPGETYTLKLLDYSI